VLVWSIEIVGDGEPAFEGAKRAFGEGLVRVAQGERTNLGERFVAVAEDDGFPGFHQSGVVGQPRLDLVEIDSGHLFMVTGTDGRSS
jgi:hypothetical protein